MRSFRGFGRPVFASGMLGLGILGLAYRDFALQWQPVPAWVPWRTALACVCAVVMLASGVGLLGRRTAAPSARVLGVYLLLWWVLLKLPVLVRAPVNEGNWLGAGEIALLVAGGWTLAAQAVDASDQGGQGLPGGARGVRWARLLFGAALLPIGLSHFVFAAATAQLVPAWLPARRAWAYLTGAGHIGAGLGVLFSVRARLAAVLEASMLTVFTVLVWLPGVFSAHVTRLQWTALTVSWALTAGAWAVAAAMPAPRGAPRPTPAAARAAA